MNYNTYENERKRGKCSIKNKCPEGESNPHAHTDTWPSTMPVYQFQHRGECIAMLANKCRNIHQITKII